MTKCALNQSSLPKSLLKLGVVSMIVVGSQVALGGPNQNSRAQIDATFDNTCTYVKVESSKNIGNVVLLYSDQSWHKVELDGRTRTAEFEASRLTTFTNVYVKSGSAKSGKVDGLPGMVGVEFTCTPRTRTRPSRI